MGILKGKVWHGPLEGGGYLKIYKGNPVKKVQTAIVNADIFYVVENDEKQNTNLKVKCVCFFTLEFVNVVSWLSANCEIQVHIFFFVWKRA